jgi:soluble lytic murein transglycosylase-like protein
MEVTLGTSGPRLRIDRPDETPEDTRRDADLRTAGAQNGAEAGGDERGTPSSEGARHLASEAPDDRERTGGRLANRRLPTRQRRTYLALLAGALLLCVLLGGYALLQHHRTGQLRDQAQKVWAGMKQQELLMARLERRLGPRADSAVRSRLSALKQKRDRQEARYRGYVRELGLRRDLTAVEKTIYRVARLFGESEFSVPAGFVRKVKATIRDYWIGPARKGYVRAIRRAEKRGYTGLIVDSLRAHGLPPELFYLALQESRFDPRAVGPRTSSGIAKGLWQFIPETARTYGLRLGPRVQQRVYDPKDERHDVEKATGAAADYLRFLYTTRARASGLLVVASYNWGEDRVVGKVGRLPDSTSRPEPAPDRPSGDPARRNYWQFLTRYGDRMPDETRDYVLKVFSAAVIGQAPKQFGFSFENPLLEHLERSPPPGETGASARNAERTESEGSGE